MSLIFATQLAAVATVVLAVFAVITGVFAFLAFREQSREVRAIEQQVKDAQELSPAAGRTAQSPIRPA